MMKTNNFTYETPEKQDDYIQSLNLSELKTNLIGKPILIEKSEADEPEEYFKTDFELQNLSVAELKKLTKHEKQEI